MNLFTLVHRSRSFTITKPPTERFLCTARAECVQIRFYYSWWAYHRVWRYNWVRDKAFDAALTRDRKSVLSYKYDLSHSSQADYPLYSYLYYKLPPFTFHPLSLTPTSSHWLDTSPSRAQQPVGDVGVHGRCMHWVWSEDERGVIGAVFCVG